MISLIATERERERGSAVRMEGAYGQMAIVRRSAEAYEAAIKNDWDKLKKLCEDDSSIMNFPITLAGNTALHIAVYSGDVEWVKDLLKLAPFPGPNGRGDTVLHETAAAGKVDMANCLIEYDRELLEIKNKRGETPLFRAAAFNNKKMVEFLASKAEDMSKHRTRNDGKSILHMTVLSKYFGSHLFPFKLNNQIKFLISKLSPSLSSLYRYSSGVGGKGQFACTQERCKWHDMFSPAI